MHLLNTTTLFGQLYETDLRLRPSGNAGLLCCHVDGFAVYQKEEAWTWEHQALVRARGILGDADLMTSFNSVRDAILSQQRDISELRTQVSNMRHKMREHLLSSSAEGVDLKQCEGGITDIEFIVQFWVLAHSSDVPALTEFTDNLRIIEATKNAGLIPEAKAVELQKAYLDLRNQYHQLTLADSKYAQDNDELDEIRQVVSGHWNTVFNRQ